MMKKRIYAIMTALAVLCSTIAPGMGAEAAETASDTTGTTYYVSTLHGKDSNDGKSEKTPFYSLQKINELKLNPGDQVLLESGSVFTNGYLHLYGQSGSAEAPIVIDQYGAGAKPVIDTNGQGVWYQNYGYRLDSESHKYQGYVSSSILLYDTEYIEINNLEIVNKAPAIETDYNETDVMNRTGVAAVAQDKGTVDHIYLNGLYVHDVIGNVYDKHMNNGGIYFTVFQPHDMKADGTSETGISRYDGVKIENCTVENVNRWGIAVGYTAYWNKFTAMEISDDIAATYGSANVVIRNNYIKDAGGDAITMMYCDRPLVEYNVSDGAARQINTTDYSKTSTGRVAAAIWPWKCKDAVFQYNEVFDTMNAENGNGDGQAWDADWGDGTLYQYNYSHHNSGGCVMFCESQAYRNTFRYNISQNDLMGAMDIARNPDAHVYNNVFYMAEGIPFIRNRGNGYYGNMKVENNIIYYAGSTPRTETWTIGGTQTYSNNLYYNYANKPESDTAAVEVAAGTQVFVDAGKGPDKAVAAANLHNDPGVRSIFDGYKLAENSPAIGKGKVIEDANGKEASEVDFFGNSLAGVTAFDIGAHQYQTNEDEGVPAAPQKPEVTEAKDTSVTLNWVPVQDLVGIEGYKIMDGDKVIADVKGGATSVVLENLKPETQYTFTIVAYDAKGVQSAAQKVVVATAKKIEAEKPIPSDTTEAKGTLSTQVTAAKALNAADYTAESWSKLQTVLKEVEGVLADTNSTKEQLDAALAKLKSAIGALQKAQTIQPPVQPSLTFDKTSATIYTKGTKTVTLKLTSTGINGSAVWKSSKPGVATVKNGKVTAKKAGKTVITAEIGSYKASCTITVKKPTLKITKKKLTLKKGKKAKIRVKVTPKGKITYKSSNKKVATVTKKGVVKGVKKGSCKITVKCNGLKKVVKVNVK